MGHRNQYRSNCFENSWVLVLSKVFSYFVFLDFVLLEGLLVADEIDLDLVLYRMKKNVINA